MPKKGAKSRTTISSSSSSSSSTSMALHQKMSSLFYPIPFDNLCEMVALAGFGYDRRELTSAEIVSFNLRAIHVEIYGQSESYITRDIIPQNSYPSGSVIVHCKFNTIIYEKGIKYLKNYESVPFASNSFKRKYTLTTCISEKGQNYDWKFSEFSEW